MGQLQALEHRINAYEANQTPQNALDYPTERLAPLETPQGLGNLPPQQEVTFAEAVRGPHAKPNGEGKPEEPRRAAPPISKSLPGANPEASTVEQPKTAPRWATVAATNAGAWQTVTRKRRNPPKQLSGIRDPGALKPDYSNNKGDRRLIFRRENSLNASRRDRADVILQLNRCLAEAGLPGFARVVDANYTESGAILALLGPGITAETLIPAYKDSLVGACHRVDPAVISVELN